MTLGDRLRKNFKGKTNSERTLDTAPTAAPAPVMSAPSLPVRWHNASNHSVLSTSSTESGGDSRRLAYPDERGAKPFPQGNHQHQHQHQHQPQQPFVPRDKQRSVSSTSTKSGPAHIQLSTMPSSGSVSSSGSASEQSVWSVGVTPAILQKGYLLVKKGLLKGYEKRYYFLTTHASDLFCCRDECHFDEWLSSGLPVRKLPGIPKSKEALLPLHVCSVLRADRTGESGTLDRAIAVIAGEDLKCASVKYLAPTADDCESWIQSFHRIQIAQRAGQRDDHPGPSTTSTHHSGTTVGSEMATPSSSHGGRPPSDTPPLGRAAATVTTTSGHGTPHSGSGASPRLSDVSDSPSHHSPYRDHPSRTPHHHVPSSSSSIQSGAVASVPPPSASGNVLLFVPATGSAIAISDSKLLAATTEMEALVASGAKRPMRGGLENSRETTWRYGPPEYVLSDLAYLKGKLRDHDNTPLESYAEACCQTFLMEATHKARYSEWTSVRQEYFYVQVNDGDRTPGHLLQEHDLFGMLYLKDYQVDLIESGDVDDRRDPCAILSEAFTQGFPMEVLDAFTQPPQCHFSWRHWGRFTGRYRGVKGTGQVLEVRGYGHMHVDNGRLMNLRLFFKQRDIFDQLNKLVAPSLQVRGNRHHTVASPAEAAMAAPARPATQPPMRSDKIGDVADINVHAAARAPLGVTRSVSQPRSNGTATGSSTAQPAAKRNQLYQQFMPQASSA